MMELSAKIINDLLNPLNMFKVNIKYNATASVDFVRLSLFKFENIQR